MTTEERAASASELPVASPAGPGARLQAGREAAGLSLEQVAQQLKLAPRQVRALEEEDFAQLPGRTFARGFVRNYARLLNLDGEDLLALLPDAVQAPALGAPALQSTGAMIAELPAANIAQPGFSRWVIPLVLVACIVGAASYEWYRGGLSPQPESKRIAVPLPSVVAPAPAPTSSVELPPLAAEEPPLASAQAMPASSAIQTSESATPDPGAAAVSPAPLQLRYRGPSWTEIRDRDGQVLLSRLLPQGSEQSVRGSAPFDIVIGNAHAVTLLYRGAPIDLTRYTHQNVARLHLT